MSIYIMYAREMNDQFFAFILEHADDDPLKLVLETSRYPDIDVRIAAGQIAARQHLKDKAPSWYENSRLYMPSSLAVEQCSSELTATYKQNFVGSEDVVVDLTGGLGIDSYYLSRKAKTVVYVERAKAYYDAAVYNMGQLKASNITVFNADAIDLMTGSADFLSSANVFYLDPSRRGAGNKRMFAIEDCEPDLNILWPLLCVKPVRVIVKLSPMLDVSHVLKQLPGVTEIHIVSVKNECKELLAIADRTARNTVLSPDKVSIHCINFSSSGEQQSFRFDYEEEKSTPVLFAQRIERYIYEPNASILKAGVFKTISARFGLKKLHPNSHLYTFENDLPSFPGRKFEVMEVYPFQNRLCKTLSTIIPQANLTIRNFPLSVDELRKRTKISEGGHIYLFATTLSPTQKVLIKTRKIIDN